MAEQTQEKHESQDGTVQIRLRWQDASDLPTLYANQVYITHAGTEFYVVFGEVQLPVLTNKKPEELEELQVKPVAKLVFTSEGIVPVVQAMADNVRKFLERQGAREEGD